MWRAIVPTLLTVGLLLAISPDCGRTAPPGRQPCDLADSLLYTIDGWQSLHRAFPELLQCDDGYIAEGISEIVVHHLAAHWRSFPELAKIARADTVFGSWVVRHIDATTDWDETALIERHARGRGPARFVVIRRRVREAARSANVESHEAVESIMRRR